MTAHEESMNSNKFMRREWVNFDVYCRNNSITPESALSGVERTFICIALVERAVGFEPTHCQVGSLVPCRLATPAQNWSREWELNPRPRDYRSRALPTELSLDKRIELVPGAGVEPA
jgi:hypothetical protein